MRETPERSEVRDQTEGGKPTYASRKSRYALHVEKWEDCDLCHLCENRNHVVLARGTIPCDVLFVGEAPGQSEDVLGRPFVGVAGKLLDTIIEQAFTNQDGTKRYTYALTNLVCCIPKDDTGHKVEEPDVDAIEACSERLVELISIASPRLIVTVGQLATQWLDQKRKKHIELPEPLVRQVAITHPAAILRMNISMKALAVQKCTVTLVQALDELDETN